MKSRRFNFRLAEWQDGLIRAKAQEANMSITDYVLHCALGKKIINYDGIEALETQLKKIGIPPEHAYKQTDFYKRMVRYERDLKLFRNLTQNRYDIMQAVQPYLKYHYDYNKLLDLFLSRFDRLNRKKDTVLMVYNEWYKNNHRPPKQDNIK